MAEQDRGDLCRCRVIVSLGYNIFEYIGWWDLLCIDHWDSRLVPKRKMGIGMEYQWVTIESFVKNRDSESATENHVRDVSNDTIYPGCSPD